MYGDRAAGCGGRSLNRETSIRLVSKAGEKRMPVMSESVGGLPFLEGCLKQYQNIEL
jgi:hypothetical protein